MQRIIYLLKGRNNGRHPAGVDAFSVVSVDKGNDSKSLAAFEI